MRKTDHDMRATPMWAKAMIVAMLLGLIALIGAVAWNRLAPTSERAMSLPV